MQVTLNEEEISTAVQNFVKTQINIAEGQEITVTFTNGRSPNGLTAALEISPLTKTAKPIYRNTTALPPEEAPAPAPVAAEPAASAPQPASAEGKPRRVFTKPASVEPPRDEPQIDADAVSDPAAIAETEVPSDEDEFPEESIVGIPTPAEEDKPRTRSIFARGA